MSDEQKPITAEQKDLKIEILEQVTALATSGLGLVAALAWNEAIKALFAQFFPQPAGNVIALIIYALVITILVVFITTKLGRAVNLAKKQLVNRQKNKS